MCELWKSLSILFRPHLVTFWAVSLPPGSHYLHISAFITVYCTIISFIAIENIKINISYILLLLEMAEKSILLMAILWIVTVVMLSFTHCWEPLVQCIYDSHQAELYFGIFSPRFIHSFSPFVHKCFKTMTPVSYRKQYIVHRVHRFPS